MVSALSAVDKLYLKDPMDRNGDSDSDGYTNLEEYLNSLSEILHQNTDGL